MSMNEMDISKSLKLDIIISVLINITSLILIKIVIRKLLGDIKYYFCAIQPPSCPSASRSHGVRAGRAAEPGELRRPACRSGGGSQAHAGVSAWGQGFVVMVKNRPIS